MSLIPVDLGLVRKCLNKRILTVSKCGYEEMSLVDYSGIIIGNTRKGITNPIYEQVFSGFTLLWKNNFLAGIFFPLIESGTEVAVTIAVRIILAVFLFPNVEKIYPLAGL